MRIGRKQWRNSSSSEDCIQGRLERLYFQVSNASPGALIGSFLCPHRRY